MRPTFATTFLLALLSSCAQRLDTAVPLGSDTSTDADATVHADASNPTGAFGDPCAYDDECLEGTCADMTDGPGGAVCAEPCDDTCADDYTCVTSLADGEGYCLPEDLCVDVDGDGRGVGVGCRGGDCDDLNAAVYEGAPELCDALDNDCDGSVDNDIVDLDFYPDSDDDGHGDATGAIVTDCVPPDGYAFDGDDCDDNDPDAYPGAPEEVADGIDQDCDGTELCFEDSDGDGYRSDTTRPSSDLSCTAFGTTDASIARDCDDARSDTHPGAEELCDDRDNDCDGQVDDDCTCGSGERACGDACIAASTCCEDADCGADATCSEPGGVCACASGFRACEGGCIADSDCCTDSECREGATCAAGTCSCAPNVSQQCSDGDVYWYDACGARGAVAHSCVGGEVCQSGSCVCTPNVAQSCSSGDVYYYDSCGNRGGIADSCSADETCDGARCVTACTPMATRGCSGGDVYWYDSCGSRGSMIADCAAGQTCADGACTCPVGTENCGSYCANTSDDEANCGGCGIVCGSRETCCTGTCADLDWNEEHCYTCGHACPPDMYYCHEGDCEDPCGNGLCDAGETNGTCYQDCPVFPDALTLSIGGSHSGSITSSDDEDHYVIHSSRFHAEMTITSPDPYDANDLDFIAYTADGALAQAGDDTTVVEDIWINDRTPIPIYIKVVGSGSATGNYTILIEPY